MDGTKGLGTDETPARWSCIDGCPRRLVDYPNLWGYARDLFQTSGIAGTVHFDHIRGQQASYYSTGDDGSKLSPSRS